MLAVEESLILREILSFWENMYLCFYLIERMIRLNLIYKKGTIEDIDLLTKTRIEVLRAANNLTSDIDMAEVERESYEYYDKPFRMILTQLIWFLMTINLLVQVELVITKLCLHIIIQAARKHILLICILILHIAETVLR